jgi:3-hydroxy-9,10-secoandrosta-1,3,5(10)-triene-9,17-dione monooxygenase reductase component
MPDPVDEPLAMFRAVTGAFATGVTIVTSRLGGRPHGFTANSFTSVSLRPPLVSVSVDRRAYGRAALRAAGHFAVSVLGAHQEPLARRFATNGAHDELFRDAPIRDTRVGAPVFDDCVAYLACTIDRTVVAGDHDIVIGRVVEMGAGPATAPLLFAGSRFRRLAAEPAAAADPPVPDAILTNLLDCHDLTPYA